LQKQGSSAKSKHSTTIEHLCEIQASVFQNPAFAKLADVMRNVKTAPW
jgi:hypothetical protein